MQGSKKSGNLKSDGLEFGDGTEHGKYRCHVYSEFDDGMGWDKLLKRLFIGPPPDDVDLQTKIYFMNS